MSGEDDGTLRELFLRELVGVEELDRLRARGREPFVVDRAVLSRVAFERDSRDPRRYLGQVGVLDLDSGERFESSFSWATTWTVLRALRDLRDLALPREPGRTPPPTVRVVMYVEPDRSLTFVRAERVGEEGEP